MASHGGLSKLSADGIADSVRRTCSVVCCQLRGLVVVAYVASCQLLAVKAAQLGLVVLRTSPPVSFWRSKVA